MGAGYCVPAGGGTLVCCLAPGSDRRALGSDGGVEDACNPKHHAIIVNGQLITGGKPLVAKPTSDISNGVGFCAYIRS